ncbi:MAG: Hsp20/alpha crystallin family protein [Spirochaetia bacterium]|jgi:spore coat protein M/HSP20 family protein|uniref:Hsp20/alpha crystallin family protein n=1 Tax=Sphaerochaeta sp. TaxID=1972642 RepID=UPI002A30F654|nr:Hsp20/alpha crystallin family protein [uncultured Sphaerochaeta sp.]MDD3058508.1 Hsp20/alpha crystallin family protein [Sphaerochaeta sp.]NCC13160.1 Hsp20/alpha crystallin family protein [Spirochaetia bacterium]
MKYYVSYNNSNPVSNFESLFNDLWSDWGVSSSKIPPVDIYETEKAYVIEAELAGYKQDEVQVNVDKHVLRISSDKQTLKDADGKKNLVRERYFKKFERSFSLPEDIDESAIEGEFSDGVLTITLPKKEEVLPKTIEVKIR